MLDTLSARVNICLFLLQIMLVLRESKYYQTIPTDTYLTNEVHSTVGNYAIVQYQFLDILQISQNSSLILSIKTSRGSLKRP